MFSVDCPRHGAKVLLPDDHIDSLDNTDHGIEVRWHCYCGQRGSFRSGRRGVPYVPVA